MARFGGIRKGQLEASDNLSYNEEEIALDAVVMLSLQLWPVILHVFPAHTNGLILIMLRRKK